MNHISDGNDNEQPDMDVLKKTKDNNKTSLNRNNKLKGKEVMQVPIVILDEISELSYINDDNYEQSDVEELLSPSQTLPKISKSSSMPLLFPSTPVTQSQSKLTSTSLSLPMSKSKTKSVSSAIPATLSQLLNNVNKLDLCYWLIGNPSILLLAHQMYIANIGKEITYGGTMSVGESSTVLLNKVIFIFIVVGIFTS